MWKPFLPSPFFFLAFCSFPLWTENLTLFCWSRCQTFLPKISLLGRALYHTVTALVNNEKFIQWIYNCMFFCTILRIPITNQSYFSQSVNCFWLGPVFYILKAFTCLIFSVVILFFVSLFCTISINFFQCFSYFLLKSCKMKQILESKYVFFPHLQTVSIFSKVR